MAKSPCHSVATPWSNRGRYSRHFVIIPPFASYCGRLIHTPSVATLR